MNKTSLEAINRAADRVLSRYGRQFTSTIRDTVVKALKSELGDRLSLVVYPDDRESIKKALTVNRNPISDISLIQQKFYNKLIGDLDSKGIVKGDPIDIPLKITRQLVLTVQDNLDDHIQFIEILHDDLLEFRELPENVADAEIEVFFTFLASAAIFGKMTFPSLAEWIYSIQFRDVHLDPDYINRRIANSSAFYRYFLPFPSNVYFMRCVLFYIKNHKHTNGIKPQWAEDHIIQSNTFTKKNINAIFKKWLQNRVRIRGYQEQINFSVADFYKAVRSSSMINLAPDQINMNRIPPFIISIQAEEIECYSYLNRYFPEFLGTRKMFPEFTHQPKRRDKMYDETYQMRFKSIIRQIRDVRRGLLTAFDSRPTRETTIKEIVRISEEGNQDLSEENAKNLSFYIKWLKHRLLDKNTNAREEYLDVKSFNDQAPMVEKFLLCCSPYDAIDQMSIFDLEETIQREVYSGYNVHNVEDVMKNFTTFIEKLDDVNPGYKAPDFGTDEMAKVSVPELKTFVTPGNLESALKEFESTYTAYIYNRFKNPEVQKKHLPPARHKARILALITELGYYTGMRFHEISLLQVKNIIFDDGVVLCIRKKTKTVHGDRNIPLSYLAPDSFVERFVQFWRERKKEVGFEGLLFVQFNGKHWDPSHTSKEIARVFRKSLVFMIFHNLRDSFAGLLLLRWLVAFHGKLLTGDLPFREEELFNSKNLSKFKKMVQGIGDQREYQDSFSHITALLAKLLGHGGPIVSLKSYCHVIDWIFYFFTKGNVPAQMYLSPKVRLDLLQLSRPTLTKLLSENDVKTSELLQLQRKLIKLPKKNKPLINKKQ